MSEFVCSGATNLCNREYVVGWRQVWHRPRSRSAEPPRNAWIGDLFSGPKTTKSIKNPADPCLGISESLARVPTPTLDKQLLAHSTTTGIIASDDCDERSENCSALGSKSDVCIEPDESVNETLIPPNVLKLVQVSKEAKLKRGTRIVIRGRLPWKWTGISALVSSTSCVNACWWRGCDNQCRKSHKRQSTICSVILLEFEDARKSALDGLLIPRRFIIEAYVVPHQVPQPSFDTAFWLYRRAHQDQANQAIGVSSPSPHPPKDAATVVALKPTTCVPMFDKILATGDFEVEGGLTTGIFIYLQIPAEVGILTYLRNRQRCIDWLLLWRGCCEDCRAGGNFPHDTNLTCYLLFLGLETLVPPDLFVPKNFLDWVKYIVASFPVQPDRNWQNWTEGLYLQKTSGDVVKRASQVDIFERKQHS